MSTQKNRARRRVKKLCRDMNAKLGPGHFEILVLALMVKNNNKAMLKWSKTPQFKEWLFQ